MNDNFDISLSPTLIDVNLGNPEIEIELPGGTRGLKGEQGPQGIQGPEGEPGYTPQKGIDYFTDEDIASLNIPNELSDLSDDSTHRLVTDTEKTTWNGKQDKLIAGSNITIASDGKTISATDTTYSEATTETTGLMSATDKTKLNGIAIGAEVNVQANWNETSSSSDAYIKNKPTIPTKTSDLTNDSDYITSSGNAATATKATGDKNGNDITTTYYKASNPNGYTSNTGTITGVSVNSTSVATSGVANITSIPASILTGAIPSTVTATTQSSGDNSTKLATTAYVDIAVSNLPKPMVFKGTLGTGGTVTVLPATPTIGDTYKVITEGDYVVNGTSGAKAPPPAEYIHAKVGDIFIAITPISETLWTLVPSGDDGNGTVTSITAGTGLNTTSNDTSSDGGTISTTGTLYLTKSGVSAGTYQGITVDKYGRVTSASDMGYTTNTGTITSVKMNGSTVASSGEADLGTVITSHQNIKTINSTSLVGTGNVTVQPTLVSGTNIKTINNESILGSGNISISSGSTYTAGNGINITSNAISIDTTVVQTLSNKVTSLSSSSTDTQYPSAKCVYDLVGDIETILTTLDIGNGV